ncbi:MAG: hypothetical protein ACI9IA_000638 [Enterobacterales bacterium]|jgi:hypothetical protein
MNITSSYGFLSRDTEVPKLHLTKRLFCDVSRPQELFPNSPYVRFIDIRDSSIFDIYS